VEEPNLIKEAKRIEMVQRQFTYGDKEEWLIVNQKIFFHVFEDPIADWMESTLAKVSNVLGIRRLAFFECEYNFPINLSQPFVCKGFNLLVKCFYGFIGSMLSLS
jgi:hypothetical protein